VRIPRAVPFSKLTNKRKGFSEEGREKTGDVIKDYLRPSIICTSSDSKYKGSSSCSKYFE
jgi:hypothetical protein